MILSTFFQRSSYHRVHRAASILAKLRKADFVVVRPPVHRTRRTSYGGFCMDAAGFGRPRWAPAKLLSREFRNGPSRIVAGPNLWAHTSPSGNSRGAHRTAAHPAEVSRLMIRSIWNRSSIRKVPPPQSMRCCPRVDKW